MPNVRLVAHPDPHMVEVPLELDAELPREFEGSALLASTGLPRKIRLKAQRDQVKLSTAYRADQLLTDIVRVAMQATPRDLERVQAAARAFVRAVRERRQDGASLRIESGERGRIEIIESMPQVPGRPRSQPPPPPAEGTGIRPAETGQERAVPASPVAEARRPEHTFEQRFVEMEAKVARLLPLADAIGHLEERISRAENRIAELESRPVGPSTSPLEGQRGLLRRATAVDAFAEGLRKELHASISTELEKAVTTTFRLDHAAGLALEAERTVGEAAVPHSDALRAASAEATAREEGLRRLQEEVDLYTGGDLPLAERLLSRFDGQKPLDPAGPLEALAKALAAAPGPEEDLSKWLARAAPLCGWTLIEPSANDPVDGEHEAREPGEVVQRVLVPGVKRSDGSLLLPARILAAARGAEGAARSTAESGGSA